LIDRQILFKEVNMYTFQDLIDAIEAKNNSLVSTILDESPSFISQTDDNGQAPLSRAAIVDDNATVINNLVGRGADLEQADPDSKTAFFFSVLDLFLANTTALHNAGSITDAPDIDGNTPLRVAALREVSTASNNMIKYLVNTCGASISAAGEDVYDRIQEALAS
jgi:ankyrin repeat protein